VFVEYGPALVTDKMFQPFLRFYGRFWLRFHLADGFMFQPFLRFYRSGMMTAESYWDVIRVSTLLKILPVLKTIAGIGLGWYGLFQPFLRFY